MLVRMSVTGCVNYLLVAMEAALMLVLSVAAQWLFGFQESHEGLVGGLPLGSGDGVGTRTVSPLPCSNLTSPILCLGLTSLMMFSEAESSMWTESADLSLMLFMMMVMVMVMATFVRSLRRFESQLQAQASWWWWWWR
jgi:hypothetical protein